MVAATNPVEVYFIEALALFCFCPPPSIFQHVCYNGGVVSTSDTVLVVDAVGFYVRFRDNVEPVGVVDSLKELSEVYH